MFKIVAFFLTLLSMAGLMISCQSAPINTVDPTPTQVSAVPAPVMIEDHATHEASSVTSPQTVPYQVKVKTLTPLAVNQAAELEIRVLNTSNQPVKHSQFRVMHGQRVHTLILDPSLVDYQHLHLKPEEGKTQAIYKFDFTPHRAGEYKIYLDVVDLKDQHYYLESHLTVPGKAQGPKLDNSLAKGKIQAGS